MRLIRAIATRCNLGDTSLRRSDVATIAFTFFTLAIGVSLIHIDLGTSPLLVMAAAVVVNSATATLTFAALMAGGGSVVASVGGGWLVTTRFGVLAAAVAPMLWPSRSGRALAAFCAFDPNVALAMAETSQAAVRRAYAVVSMALVLPWWVGSGVGIAVANWIESPRAFGMDAMFPALFLAVVWPQMRTVNSRTIGVAAVVISVSLLEFLPGGLPVLLAAITALWALRSVAPAGSAPANGTQPTQEELLDAGPTEPGDDRC